MNYQDPFVIFRIIYLRYCTTSHYSTHNLPLVLSSTITVFCVTLVTPPLCSEFHLPMCHIHRCHAVAPCILDHSSSAFLCCIFLSSSSFLPDLNYLASPVNRINVISSLCAVAPRYVPPYTSLSSFIANRSVLFSNFELVTILAGQPRLSGDICTIEGRVCFRYSSSKLSIKTADVSLLKLHNKI